MRGTGVSIGIAQRQPIFPVRTSCIRVQFPNPHRPTALLSGRQKHVSSGLVGLGESRVGGVAPSTQGGFPEQTASGFRQSYSDHYRFLGDFVYCSDYYLRIAIEVEVSQQRLGGWLVPPKSICKTRSFAANHQISVAPRPEHLAGVSRRRPACHRAGQPRGPGIEVHRPGGVVCDQNLLNPVIIDIRHHGGGLDVLRQAHVHFPCQIGVLTLYDSEVGVI